MFSGNEIKQQNKICDLSKNKICGFLCQVPTTFFNLLILFTAHLNMHSKKHSFLYLFNNKKPTKNRSEP